MPYTTARTFYDILELDTSASRIDVKDAYKKMALKRHPDKNPDDQQAKAKFQEVSEAYNTLYDNAKRKVYNDKIEPKKALPLRTPLFTGTASRWASTTPYHQPSAFWSEASKPKRSQRAPKPTEFAEDWNKPDDWSAPYEEPKQDWYEQWQKQEEIRNKQFQELMAKKLEQRRKEVEAKVPSALAATVQTILFLNDAINGMEKESEVADAMIEKWVDMDVREADFFDEVYQRNIRLNKFRRELEINMQKYEKLSKKLKTFDSEQGGKADRIYKKLQKMTIKRRESMEHKSQGVGHQDHKGKEQHNYQDEEKESDQVNEEYLRRAEEEYHRQKAKQREEARRRAQQEELMKYESSSSLDKAFISNPEDSPKEPTGSDSVTNEGVVENDDSKPEEADDGDEADEEIILFQSRLIHNQHLSVHSELWDIAEGWHVEWRIDVWKARKLGMDSYDLLIVNGLVVTSADTGHYDIAIKDEKIALLAPTGGLAGINAKRTLDAEGGYVMPGGVDAHVHLEEPPLFGKGRSADTYETGTRSAICGGTTTVVTFAPQSRSDPSLLSILESTHAKAEGNCYSDYSFHLLVGNPSPAALAEFPALRERGISSLKIYMTYEVLQLRDNQILDVLLAARKEGITTMIHAENGDVLAWMTDQLEQKGLYSPKHHATSRPQLLETEATHRAIALSSLIDAPILIVHVSSPSAAQHIRDAQTRGLPIYAETCPQYLFLTRADLDKPGFEGAKCVCSPPPREGAGDQEGIWRGVGNGTFAVLSSDHCPFLYGDGEVWKRSSVSEQYPQGRFRYIPNGIPGIETRLPLVLSADRIPLSKFVEVTSTNPAKLYGLYPKKGAVMPGISDADLMVWYPPGRLGEVEIKNENLHHANDYTPYEGRRVSNWPRWTVLRGKVVWDRDGGGVLGGRGYGVFVERGGSCLDRGSGVSEGEWDVGAF